MGLPGGLKICGQKYRTVPERMNWVPMCIVVTKRGNGKLKYAGLNIHLLYMDSSVANANLVWCMMHVMSELLSRVS